MPRYEHSGAATAALATIPITNSGLTLQADNLTGWPTGAIGNFWGTLDRGLATEEKVLFQSRSGNTLTIAPGGRGADGTTAQSHAVGATIEHTYSATEADEASAHIQASTGVHGVSGSVVGTTGTQTLTNKTLTSPTINGATLSGAVTSTATVTGGTVNPTVLQQGGVQAVTTTGTQTLTGKTLTSPVLNTPTLNGSGGALALPAGPDTIVGRATTDTLTNKTLTSPTINGGTISAATMNDIVAAASASGNIAVSVRGASGQTARIFEVLSNAGTTYFYVSNAGSVQCPINLNVNGSFASNASTALTNTTAVPSSASGTALIAKGLVGQTGYLQEWQNSAGTAVASIAANGGLVVPGISLNGVGVPRIQRGTGSVTFSAGNGTLTYGTLGFTPGSVQLTPVLGGSSLVLALGGAPGATSVAVKAFDSAGNPFTGSLTTVHWLAIE